MFPLGGVHILDIKHQHYVLRNFKNVRVLSIKTLKHGESGIWTLWKWKQRQLPQKSQNVPPTSWWRSLKIQHTARHTVRSLNDKTLSPYTKTKETNNKLQLTNIDSTQKAQRPLRVTPLLTKSNHRQKLTSIDAMFSEKRREQQRRNKSSQDGGRNACGDKWRSGAGSTGPLALAVTQYWQKTQPSAATNSSQSWLREWHGGSLRVVAGRIFSTVSAVASGMSKLSSCSPLVRRFTRQSRDTTPSPTPPSPVHNPYCILHLLSLELRSWKRQLSFSCQNQYSLYCIFDIDVLRVCWHCYCCN